jgi:alkylation response protein AidB-like acyl-CoA dehydrogenase
MSTRDVSSGAALEAECLDRARTAAEVIRREAPQIEATRQLTPAVLEAMHSAELFRLLMPRELGGAELPPGMANRVTQIIAAADASAGWCLGQSFGCSMSSVFMGQEAAAKVFGPRNAVLAWGAGVAGKAVATDGGYLVSGTWRFASGGFHATWLGAHCFVFEADGTTPRLKADGGKVDRTGVFPRELATMHDDWHVMGLKGTRSEGYTVENLFIAEELTLDRDDFSACRVGTTVFKFPTTNVYASAFSGVALGNARGMLDSLIELGRDKTPRGARSSMRDNPIFQTQVAEMDARLGSASAYVLNTLDRIWDEVAASGELTLDQRVQIRLATTFAINQATDVVGECHRFAGSSAIFENNVFERRFRDAHAVSQQVQGRKANYETVGRHMMELETDMLFL